MLLWILYWIRIVFSHHVDVGDGSYAPLRGAKFVSFISLAV
jgi:hypothetical protein